MCQGGIIGDMDGTLQSRSASHVYDRGDNCTLQISIDVVDEGRLAECIITGLLLLIAIVLILAGK